MDSEHIEHSEESAQSPTECLESDSDLKINLNATLTLHKSSSPIVMRSELDVIETIEDEIGNMHSEHIEHSEESPQSPTECMESESLEHSDSDLEIDLNATLRPHKFSSPILMRNELDVIETMEVKIGNMVSDHIEHSEESPQSPTECLESESLEHSDSDLEIDLNATLPPRKSSSPILMRNELDDIETMEDEIGNMDSEHIEHSEESPQSPTECVESESLEHSDSDLEIDLNATSTPRKSSSSILMGNELDIIETIEDEIGKQLDEKADKSNLTVTNVKTIIRQVLTNEYVKNMLLEGISGENNESLPKYEVKLTRAKAKEILSSNPVQVSPSAMPWVPQLPPSETQVLIGEDLKEDDSGDEYVPEESEDERDESVASESDTSSLPPPTPPTPMCMEDQSTQTTNYTDDGVFKIPPPKTADEQTAEEAANIALRTRSKINLSSTPLEVIEKSFIPPDITTDMYDLECDDDDWREFLKGFTEPLEEVTKPTEDDEHDPEYNILADDKINHVDNEDFRIDKAVKITKKEVKELWEEVFEYLNNMSDEYDDVNKDKNQSTINEVVENVSQDMNIPSDVDAGKRVETSDSAVTSKKMFDITIGYEQLCIIEQQMRQHVQILTQNFFLSYEHPEFHENSYKFNEYLLNLKHLCEGKPLSLFRPANLKPALKLIDSWIELCASNCEPIKETREHIRQELLKSIQYKMAGNWEYVVSFPKLILEKISKSEVFLYPSLLPKIPYKSEQFSGGRCVFTDAEDNLLVFGLEQFKHFLSEHKKVTKITLTEIVSYVQEYMMPHRSKQSILKHIYKCKHPRCATNTIQQYILRGKLKPVIHYIYPLNQIIAPCNRMPDELPIQWRDFIFPVTSNTSQIQNIVNIQQFQSVVPQQVVLINNSILQASPLLAASRFILATPPQVQTPKRRQVQTSKRRRTNSSKTSLVNKFNSSPNASINLSALKPTSQNSSIISNSLTTIEQFIAIFVRPIAVQKLVKFLAETDETEPIVRPERVFIKINPTMFPNMPSLNTPVKSCEEIQPEEAQEESIVTSTTIDKETDVEDNQSSVVEKHQKPKTVTSSTVSQEKKREKVAKTLEFSTITSSSFQKANTSTEVEFCRNSSDIQICQTSQCDKNDTLSSSGSASGKDIINAPSLANSTAKPEVKANPKKELSGAEKKKIKLRKDFLANLTIAAPENPESEKHKSEMFAVAYYDKLRETLDLEDYHKIMQVLNDFGAGDVVDLYYDVQAILTPKYSELAEEFIFFLKEKEASAVGQLIPWLEIHTRTKFLRKLEIYLKDQPSQLKKIYNTLMELTKAEDSSMEKIKSILVPMLKGNTILLELFLQNFRDERPPKSLLEGPYETIDLSKELARPDNEDVYETFVVPNTEDKYGGQNCICHCHRIEDKEYKSRSKHCTACGLKFANGRLYLTAGRIFQPATVTFKTSPGVNHNARLMGKTAQAASHRKKRLDTSPSKLASSGGKENLEEDTEDEDLGKRKKSISQKTPRKRKKTDVKYQEANKSTSPKKSPGRSSDPTDIQKDNIKPRKRTYSGKKSKKEESNKKTENEPVIIVEENRETIVEEKAVDEEFEIIAELEESEHETSEEHPEKLLDDCMDSSGESLEKPLTPGQQTAESESEIYLEESSQDNYESDDSTSSMESAKGSQSDSNTNDEPPWRREEDTVILETLQKEDDKEYALQIISDKLPNRTVGQIRNRLSRLMDLLIETLKHS